MGDIILINYESFDLSILESLDEYFEKEELEKFREEVIKSLYYNEQLLGGVPVGLSTYAMYLNLDKFNERGMSPPLNGDWTYEEFVETLKSLGNTPPR